MISLGRLSEIITFFLFFVMVVNCLHFMDALDIFGENAYQLMSPFIIGF